MHGLHCYPSENGHANDISALIPAKCYVSRNLKNLYSGIVNANLQLCILLWRTLALNEHLRSIRRRFPDCAVHYVI